MSEFSDERLVFSLSPVKNKKTFSLSLSSFTSGAPWTVFPDARRVTLPNFRSLACVALTLVVNHTCFWAGGEREKKSEFFLSPPPALPRKKSREKKISRKKSREKNPNPTLLGSYLSTRQSYGCASRFGKADRSWKERTAARYLFGAERGRLRPSLLRFCVREKNRLKRASVLTTLSRLFLLSRTCLSGGR